MKCKCAFDEMKASSSKGLLCLNSTYRCIIVVYDI